QGMTSMMRLLTIMAGPRSHAVRAIDAAGRRRRDEPLRRHRRRASGPQSGRWYGGRIARACDLALGENRVAPAFHLGRTAFADCMRAFDANDLHRAPAISPVHVVQHLSGLEHDALAPSGPVAIRYSASSRRRPISVILKRRPLLRSDFA